MKIHPDVTLEELAFIVCTTLEQNGILAVLTGGGAATVYAPNTNQSSDIDFVLSYSSTVPHSSPQPLLDLGFVQEGDHYKHDQTPFTIDFPSGPLAIGNELVHQWETLRRGELLLHLLSPTDCVRDRLAWFYFYDDQSALTQALAVAQSQPIDQDAVEKWSRAENELTKFEVFKTRLSHSST